jgi:hypothetical protein
MKRATQWPWLSVVDMRRGLSRPFMPRPLCFVFCVLCFVFCVHLKSITSMYYRNLIASKPHVDYT